MRGLLSLDQELRAVRRAKEQKKAGKSNRSSDPKETERPWQSDIDKVNETMREVLRSIAGLSGVELPGLPSGLEDNEAPTPRLDIKNLKDRLRNDLEGFSVKTTEELAKKAKEQTHAALDAMQNDLGGRIDQIAAEFREKIQLAGQVEKLLEPGIAEATARIEKSFSQKVEQLVADRERLVQDKLQEALAPVQEHITNIEESEARLEQSLSHKVEQLVAEQAQVVQDKLQEALRPVQEHMSTIEGAETRLERSLSQKVEQLIAEQARLVQEKLEKVPAAIQPQVNTVAETEARLERSLSQKVQQLIAEQARLVQEKIEKVSTAAQPQVNTVAETEARLEQSLYQKVEQLFAKQDQLVQEKLEKVPTAIQPQINTVEEAEARLERSLSQKVEQLVAEQARLAQDRLQGALSSVQVQISVLEQTMQQIRELKSASAAQSPTLQNSTAGDGPKKGETRTIDEANGDLDQAFSRIKASFKNLLGNSRLEPAQQVNAGLEGQSKGIPFDDSDVDSRVQQALENLGRLGTKESPSCC